MYRYFADRFDETVLYVTNSGAASVTANRILAVVGLFVGVTPVTLGMHAVLVTL